MPYITVFLNRKGGVGKSLDTVNLAAVYAEILGSTEEDSTVAVVSIDPQATSVEHAEAVRRAGRPVPFRVVNAKNNVDQLRKLRRAKADIIIVDTPGFMPLNDEDEDDESIDPLGDGTVGDSLRAVLDVADDAIVPLPAEGAAFRPTRTTIERVLIPRQLPYGVLISWDPRDGEADRDRTISLVEKRGWDRYGTTIRRYKPHTRGIISGRFCTQYESNHTATKAKQDFVALALEHQLRRQKYAGGR
ncbi:Putative plasmid partitioning protein ParA OS=Streptomyces rochei OX=1928 GN=pSLA2-S.16 PE=4 SV=1 [Streptomyces rochei]|uniref:ParA family protein n=1 Tax=Streptomyces sp. NRRL WC-3795 TaxID=1463938 RepID=UPI0004CAE7AE|nr:ParA family protein [Streptomyces sp. NRRL WC-3795]